MAVGLLFRDKVYKLSLKWGRSVLIRSLITAPAGILVYFFLEHIIKVPIGDWLSKYELTGYSLWAMVFYFGLVHPIIEQIHWAPLREKSHLAHGLFAGYHLLVLKGLLPVGWLGLSFLSLSGISVIWAIYDKQFKTNTASILTHIFADLGLMVAVVFLLRA